MTNSGLWTRLADAVGALKGRAEPGLVSGEVAVSQDSLYASMPTLQYSPDELLTKKGFKTLEKMMTDDQINTCITALKLIRLSSGYDIEEGEDTPQGEEIADFVGYVFDHMRAGCSFHNVLFNICGGLEMGWSLQECVWGYYKEGKYKGKIGLEAIKSKNPQHFNVSVDQFSNPRSIVSISGSTFGTEYPIEKFLVYSFQKRYENVFGSSRLRSLYSWWWVKQVMVRAMGVYMEKFGLPVPIGKFPRSFTKEQQDDFLTALTKLRIEHAIILPDGATVDFKEATGKGSEAFLNIIEKADAQIAKVIMGQTLTSGVGKGGGGGEGGLGTLGKVQFDILVMYLEYLGLDLSMGPLATIIKTIVDYNYPGVENYPVFKFKPLFPEDLSPQIDSIIKCTTAGLVVATPEDEEYLRKILGFEGGSGNTAKLRTTKPKAKGLEKKAPEQPKDNEDPEVKEDFAERSAFSKKVDFPGVREAQDAAVAAILPPAQELLRTAVEALMKQVASSRIVEENKIGLINELDLKGKGELNKLFSSGLEKVSTAAARDARREVRTTVKHATLDWMTPKETLKFLKEKAFWMTDVTVDSVLKRVKTELFNGIKTGKSYGDIYHAVLSAVEPYLGKPGVGSGVSSGMLAAHLETAVRTNIAEAYNQSRDAVFTSPEMQDFVVAFEYSAVLDDRTRSGHQAMDGRIYLATDPIWKTWTPPNGFNCRCMKIPITKFEKFKVSPPPPANVKPDEGFK